MAQTINGHTWQRHPELQPSLLCAVRTETDFDGGSTACHSAVWVLDYSWGSCGEYRVPTSTAPWRKRKPMEAHLYPPNCSYWERLRPSRQRCAFILFDWATPTPAIAEVQRNGYGIIQDTEGLLGQCIRSASVIGQNLGESGFWQAQAELCRVIALLECVTWNGNLGWLQTNTSTEHNSWENSVKQLIANYTNQTLCLDQLAAELGVSRSTLSHRYRSATGESPLQSHAQFRLIEARKRLLAGQSVTEVASELGFGDIYHFSRFFKRWQGVSPREYARSFFHAENYCAENDEIAIS